MSISQQSTTQASAIASLFTEALRQGQTLWFRVASGSMSPTIEVGNHVRIEPVQANELRIGEIAAFETSCGLVIHRIVHRQEMGLILQLLEMADVDLCPGWIEEQSVVGRVITIRRGGVQIDLQHPVAQWCGTVTASLRYRLYRWKKYRFFRRVLHECSRLAVYIAYWSLRSSPATSVVQDEPLKM